MSTLRVEGVKEALEAWDIGVLTLPDEEEWTVPPEQEAIVAAARAWLQSQEQTPDYEAAADWLRRVGLAGVVSDDDIEGGFRAMAEEVANRALVGFHPQPEGGD